MCFLFRRFPTVERRGKFAKGSNPDKFFPLPDDAVVAAEVVKKCSVADEQVCSTGIVILSRVFLT